MSMIMDIHQVARIGELGVTTKPAYDVIISRLPLRVYLY